MFFPTSNDSANLNSWLIANGKIEQARAIFVKYHAGGDVNSELVEWEMFEIEETIRLERENVGTNVWKEMISTKANRKRVYITLWIGITGQWLGVGAVFYYLYLVSRMLHYRSMLTVLRS